MFWHFFNNDISCPNSEECLFLHEDSEQCKYGELCDRDYCMYKHDDDESLYDENQPYRMLFEQILSCKFFVNLNPFYLFFENNELNQMANVLYCITFTHKSMQAKQKRKLLFYEKSLYLVSIVR